MDGIDFSISAGERAHCFVWCHCIFEMNFGRSTNGKYITSASIMANAFLKQKKEFMPILNYKKVSVRNVARPHSALFKSEPCRPGNVTQLQVRLQYHR